MTTAVLEASDIRRPLGWYALRGPSRAPSNLWGVKILVTPLDPGRTSGLDWPRAGTDALSGRTVAPMLAAGRSRGIQRPFSLPALAAARGEREPLSSILPGGWFSRHPRLAERSCQGPQGRETRCYAYVQFRSRRSPQVSLGARLARRSRRLPESQSRQRARQPRGRTPSGSTKPNSRAPWGTSWSTRRRTRAASSTRWGRLRKRRAAARWNRGNTSSPVRSAGDPSRIRLPDRPRSC